jgi:hypothetical protein
VCDLLIYSRGLAAFIKPWSNSVIGVFSRPRSMPNFPTYTKRILAFVPLMTSERPTERFRLTTFCVQAFHVSHFQRLASNLDLNCVQWGDLFEYVIRILKRLKWPKPTHAPEDITIKTALDVRPAQARVLTSASISYIKAWQALLDQLPANERLPSFPIWAMEFNIIDVLSPEFVEVLDLGDGYVGGIDFFGGNRQFARVILADEVPSAENHITEPPESLLEALRVFFIGVSAGRPTWGRMNPNRSMLVHPSRTTLEHFQYFQSIQFIKDEWAAKCGYASAARQIFRIQASLSGLLQNLSRSGGSWRLRGLRHA